MDVTSRVGDWLNALADRLGIGPATVLVGVVAVCAAGAGAWWALRPPAPPPAEQVLPRASGVADAALPLPAATSPTTSSVAPVVMIHVDGAVITPGLHELAPGARVADAIAAAQGLRDDADRGRLNLAAPVADGQRLWVPVVGEDEPPVVGPVGPTAATADTAGAPSPVDLNVADAAALESLPGIGPSIAAAILAHRDDHGPFRSVQELLEVPGIGPTRLARLEPLVVV